MFRTIRDEMCRETGTHQMVALRRAALLIALTYTDPNDNLDTLQAPPYDLARVRNFLIRQGITDITEITDANFNPLAGLRTNIMRALDAFMRRTKAERMDFAFVFYAGHGAQIPDTNNDENNEVFSSAAPNKFVKGQDEVIMPTDAQYAGAGSGPITDDTLNRLLQLADPATHITMLMDCCNSGTMADLKYEYRSPGNWVVNRNAIAIPQKVYCMSGCVDRGVSNEVDGSVDFLRVEDQQHPGGLLTCCLLELLGADPGLNDSILRLQGALQTRLGELLIPQSVQMNTSRQIVKDVPFILR
jgi:hypothetical protein